MSPPELFLSHAAADAGLAAFVEREARENIAGIKVFRTTRVGQLRPGREWLAEIQKHLRSADRFLILLTPQSVGRPWISFETGAAWIRQRAMVPGLAGGLQAHDVPEPLRSLQLLSLEDANQAGEAFRELGGTLSNPHAFAANVQKLAEIGKRLGLEEQGWRAINFNGDMYAWDGPLEQLPESRPLPIPDGLIEAIKAEGIKPTQGIAGDLMNEFSKGYAQIYKVDNFKRKHPLASKDGQVLLVNPDKKP